MHIRGLRARPIGASCMTLDPNSAVAQHLTLASLAILASLRVIRLVSCMAGSPAWPAPVLHFLLHSMRCQKCMIRIWNQCLAIDRPLFLPFLLLRVTMLTAVEGGTDDTIVVSAIRQ
jgi:hypothetical protein